jgi:hypothetical protein
MFWNIIIGILSYALQLALAPKPQNAKAKSLEDFQAPTAQEGREIPVVFGTCDIADPNVTWYGDLKRDAIKGARRYGLFGPRQVIGYKYSLGMQMALCHGPADDLMRITVGDKLAWKGHASDTQITISKSKLFGGDQSEGGISGKVDVCMGEPTQLQNDYLVAQLGENISAFRGIVTIVLRQVYLGTSNYIKPWEFRLQRILLKSDGSDQWYPEKAPVPAEATTADNIAFYFALDTSSSVVGARLQALKAGAHDAIDTMRSNTDIKYDVRMVSFGSSVKASTQYRNCTADNFDSLDDWVDGLASSGNTNFLAGLSQAEAFFDGADSKKTPCIIIISDNADQFGDPISGVADAQAIIDTLEDVPVYCFRAFGAGGSTMSGATLEGFDNTPADNHAPGTGGDDNPVGEVPVIHFGSANLDSAMTPGALIRYYDMNPAHIIRECLTDSNWGMGYNDSDIDDTAFTACANTFYSEGFGLSLRWSREEEIQEFVSTVLAHIDAYLYVSRSTGKFVLKAIRNDYDIDTIPVLDEDDVIEWTEVSHRQLSEAVSSVIVNYYNREKRKDGSHSVTNIAQSMQATKVLSTTRDYPGINYSSLAIRVATRDVIALGSGLVSGRLVAKRTIEGMNPGDPFRLVSSRHQLSGEVMRVADLNFGDGRQNKIGLKYFQDVFNLSAAVLVDDSESPWQPPSNEPLEVSPRIVWEMPYRELRQMVGDADLATMLTTDPGAGLIQVAGVSPTADAVNADLKVDSGSGFAGTELMDFAPGGFLDGDLAIDATTVTLTTGHGVDEEDIGLLAVIGDGSRAGTEVVQIDDVVGDTITIARACLDSVPQAHSSGASFVLFDDLSISDFETYADGESVDVKLLTNTGLGQLDEAVAPADTIVFASRGIRPLRPADVQYDGIGYGLVPWDGVSDIAVTWAERSRLLELDSPPSWTDATVASEAGQTTIIEVLDPTATSVVTTHSGLTGTSFNVPAASFGGNSFGWIRVGSERDGYREWQAYQLPVVDTLVQTASYTLTGNDARIGPMVAAGTGSFALSGSAAVLGLSFGLGLGSFALTGSAANLILASGFAADPGSFVLSGSAAHLNVSMAADTGSFSLTGNNASLFYAAGISAGTGSFTLTGSAAGLTFTSAMVASYEGATLDNSNLTTYTFTAKNVGAAGTGRVIVVAVQTRTTSIGTPRSISGVTCNGNAMTAGPILNGSASGAASIGLFYIVEASGTTANFVVTFSNGTQNCAIATWRLFPVSSTPVDSVATSFTGNTATLTDLEVKITGLALILVDSGRTATPQLGSFSWNGVDTPVHDLTDQINDQNSSLNLFSIPTTENDTTRDFAATATGNVVGIVGLSFQ